jgi:hypothetical protein
MNNPFGRYSLPSVLGRLFGHEPQSQPSPAPSGDHGFGRYSLPNVLGRLFHHGQTTSGYDSSGINPGGIPFGGATDWTFNNSFNGGISNPFDTIGNGGYLGGDLNNNAPFSPGYHAPTGQPSHSGGMVGGGASQTTNGFTTAFRGGGDVYDPAQFIRDLRTRGGTAFR